jgi:hypothetical protein
MQNKREVQKLSASPLTAVSKWSSKRPWRLSYGGENVFYLTEAEKTAFSQAVFGGNDVIEVNGMILTRFFKCLVLVDESGLQDYQRI